MAAGLARHIPSFTKGSNGLGSVRYLNYLSNSSSTSKGKKLPNAAFLLGFGLASLVGFSGLYEKKLKRAKATSVASVEGTDSGESVPHVGLLHLDPHYYSKKMLLRHWSVDAYNQEAQQLIDNTEIGPPKARKKENLNRTGGSPWTLQCAIDESRSIIQCMKEECGSPGVSVAVIADGKTVWSEGFGFADVENRVLCSGKTVMRIASISKPLTATAAAKLWEEGKLDLDAPIQTYVESFPKKTFNGATVTLTTRHLLSHLGGIRNYEKSPANKVDKSVNRSNTSNEQLMPAINNEQTNTLTNTNSKQSPFSFEEFYIKDHYKTVSEALSLFKDDSLLCDPGSSYLYTTHGWTLVSAVIEKAANQDFLLFMKKLFKDLGMENTCAEFNDKIIHNRARFYQRNKKGHLVNAPYVDNSYKWAGGGFMSTAEDLVQFGNSMLYAKQMGSISNTAGCLPGFLRPESVTELWKIVAKTQGQGHKDGGYGLGWAVIPEKQDFGACYHQSETILHLGGAVGASSVLLIRPTCMNCTEQPPKGVIVALLVNLQAVNLEKTAMAVAACFEKTQL